MNGLLRTRSNFSKTVMVSFALSTLDRSNLVFIDPGVKINGALRDARTSLPDSNPRCKRSQANVCWMCGRIWIIGLSTMLLPNGARDLRVCVQAEEGHLISLNKQTKVVRHFFT